MARQKEFDRDEALERAMEVFWRRGYEATSVQNLVDGMGVSRQSIYDTFGDKRALYLAALDRYRRQNARRLTELFDAPLPAREQFRRLFAAVIDEAIADETRRGCFMANATVELAAVCAETAARACDNSADMEKRFERVLAQARARGELANNRSPRALARFLFSSLLGLRVMAKTTRDRRALEDVARVTLSILD